MEFAVGVSILNFVDVHGSEGFDFILYSDSGLPNLVAALGSRGISVKVIVYNPPVKWVELYSSKAVAYFSPLVLSKFEIFENLKRYSRVVWLDYDIVIKNRLTELLATKNFDFAYFKSDHSIVRAFINAPKDIDLTTLNTHGMSAGLMVVTDSFPDHQKVAEKLYGLYLQHNANLFLPEQAIFDIFLENLDYKWLELDREIYCDNPDHEIAQSLIVHASGPEKFWNGRHNNQWESYYQVWLSIGGVKFGPYKTIVQGLIRRFFFAIATITKSALSKRGYALS